MGAPLGNQYNKIYTERVAILLFEKALKYAQENKNCLCMQDAVAASTICQSTFYYLCEQFENLKKIKVEINSIIIRRINKGDLTNKYNVTAAIWRMKQLGETDRHETDITTQGEKINNIVHIDIADRLAQLTQQGGDSPSNDKL